MSVCNNCFKFSNFEKLILKNLKSFARHFSNVKREWQILRPLLLLETPSECSILDFSSLFFFYKKVKPTSNDNILLTTIHTYDCKQW